MHEPKGKQLYLNDMYNLPTQQTYRGLSSAANSATIVVPTAGESNSEGLETPSRTPCGHSFVARVEDYKGQIKKEIDTQDFKENLRAPRKKDMTRINRLCLIHLQKPGGHPRRLHGKFHKIVPLHLDSVKPHIFHLDKPHEDLHNNTTISGVLYKMAAKHTLF